MPWEPVEAEAPKPGGKWEPIEAVQPTSEASGWAPVDKDHYIDLTAAYARKHGIREDVFLALHQQESGFNPNAKSPTGVKGISQMTLGTGKAYGIKSDADRLDPHKSLDAAGAHFADLLRENGGSYSKALKSYGGPTDPRYEQNVGRHLGWARKTLEGRQPLDLNPPAPLLEQPPVPETPLWPHPEAPPTGNIMDALPKPTGDGGTGTIQGQIIDGKTGRVLADRTPEPTPLFDTSPTPEFTPAPKAAITPPAPGPNQAPFSFDRNDKQPGLPELPASVTYETGRKAMPKKMLTVEGWTPTQLEDGSWTLVKGNKRTKESFGSAQEAQNYGFSPGENIFSATMKAPTGTSLIQGLGKLPGRIKLRAGASDTEMGEMLRRQLPYAHEERDQEAALLEHLDKIGLGDNSTMRISAPSSRTMQAFEAGMLPYDKLSPEDKQAIIAKYATKSLLQGVQGGFTMAATGNEAPMPGTEIYRQAGELIGSLVPLGAAINTGKFAVKAFFPLVAETLAGRVGAAGVGGLAFGAGRSAIQQAATGQPATMEAVGKIAESGAQDALLFMGLHFGGETAAAYLANKIPLVQTSWEKASSDLKDFYNRKLGKQVVDLPATVSKEEIISRLSKMDDETRKELLWGITDPTLKGMLKPGMGQGSPALLHIWREANIQAWKEAGEEVAGVRAVRAAKEGAPVTAPTPEPQVPPSAPTPAPRPENVFQDYIMQTGGHQGDPAAMAQDLLSKRGPTWAFSPHGVNEITGTVKEANAIYHDLGLVYRTLHPDSKANPDEIWQHLTPDDMRAMTTIDRGKTLLDRLQTAATLRMAEAQQELLGQQEVQAEKDAITAQVAAQKQVEAEAKVQQKEVEAQVKTAEKEAQTAAKEKAKGKLRRVKKVQPKPSDAATKVQQPASENVPAAGGEVPVVRFNANPADLAADYKARGIKRQEAWSRFVQDKNLSPGMDAADFYKIYDSVSPDLLKPKSVRPTETKSEVGPLIVDPEMARFGEPIEYKTQIGKGEYKWESGEIQRVLNDGKLFEVKDKEGNVWRMDTDSVRFTPAPAEPATGKANRLRTKPAPTTPKEFSQQHGTARGVKPKGLMSRASAVERHDVIALIREHGRINSQDPILKNFAPEERRRIHLRLTVKPVLGKIKPQGADEMLQELKSYPGLVDQYDTGEDLLRAFLSGDLYKTLDVDKLEKEAEEYYAREQEAFERDAEALGLTPEEFAELETKADREAAEYERRERDAIQSEGSAGPESWETELDELYPKSKLPFFLTTPPTPKTPKLTKRLDALQAEYPDLNRERAALVIRSLPEAEDFQVANLSEDPEMFNRVVRGNLKASEKQALLDNSKLVGQQMGLPGLTPPGRLFKLPEEGATNVPGQRAGTVDKIQKPQDRSERLARDEERLGRELGGFRSRRHQEFNEGRLPQADAKLWQEVTYNPALLASPEFQAITAAAKAVGIAEVLPIKSQKISGCIFPERDGRQIMLLSDAHLGTNSLSNVAGHETFHYRLGRRDWPAVKLFRAIDSRTPTFKRYQKYLDREYKKRGFEPLSVPQVKDEIAANLAGGITVPGFDFTQAVIIAPEDLQAILTDYRTHELASQQAAAGDLISKFFLDTQENKAGPPLTKKEQEMGSTLLSMGINPEQFKIAKRGLDAALEIAFNKFNDWGIRPPGKITRRLMDKYVPTELQRQGIANWLRFAYFPEHVARTRPAFEPMRQADIAAGDKSAELRDEIWGRLHTYFKELNPESRGKVDALLLRLDRIQKLDARQRLEEKVQEKGFEYFKGFKGNLLNDQEAKAVYGIWGAMQFIRKDLTGSMIEHLADYGAARGLEPEKARKFAGEIALNLDKPVGQVIAEYFPEVKAGTRTAKGEPATEEVVIGGQKYWASEAQAKDIAQKVGIEPIRIDKQAKGYVVIGPATSAGPKTEKVVSGIEKTLQKQRDTIQFWLRDRAFYLLPHTRWGPFWVRVSDKEGKMVWAGARETTAAAKQMLEDAKGEFGEEHTYKMTREDKKPMELYNNVNMPAVSAIMELAKDKMPAENRMELLEAWQTFWAAKGWGAHLIHRSNIPGFEAGNLRRVFSDYIEGYVGMRSKMVRANGFTKAWEGFTEREGGNDPALQRYTLEYTRYLLDHPYEYSWIRRILYHAYLGASMGFRLLHGLHAVQTAWPVLSTVTKGSAQKLSKAYLDRYALTLEKMGATGKTSLVTDMERKALEIGKRHEALQDSYQQEIAAKAGSPFYRWLYNDPTSKKSKALDIWKNIYYPGESDKWLREGMFLASLRVLDPQFSTKPTLNREAVDKALALTQEAFFRYARGDRPPIGRGLGAIWFTFQTWVTKYFQLIAKGFTGNIGPEATGKMQGGALLRFLLAALAIGGTTGAGIYGVASRVYRKTTGRHLADDVKNYAQAMFGEKAGTFASRTVINGLPASVFGFDLSQRMVHHLPLVEESDKPTSWAQKITGAVSGPFEKAAIAGAALEKGEPRRAAESLAPNFIGNPLKAQRLYSQDPTTLSGRPILGADLKPHRLGMAEAVMKGVGVQPIRLSEEQSRQKFANLQEQDLKARKDKFVNRLSKAVKAQDQGEITAVVKEISTYNQEMIKAGREADVITDQSIRSSVQQRMKPVVPDKSPKKMILRQKQSDSGKGFSILNEGAK